MAIYKETKTKNKIPASYHRIAMINVQMNQQVTILVESYVETEDRQYEKDYACGKIEDPVFPFTDSDYINIPWKECGELLTGDIITNAYNWLKKQPQFENATDI